MNITKPRHSLRYSIIIFWFIAMLLLARYEAYPELFTHTLHGYRSVLPEDVLIQDSWARIIINGTAAGYSHTGMNIAEGKSPKNMEINNNTRLKIAIMGQPLSIRIKTTLLLDPMYDLINFKSSVSSSGTSLQVIGQRENNRNYKITTLFGTTKTERIIKIPQDVLLYSPMDALALRSLKPGKSISIKTMDPLSMTPTHIIVKAIKKEHISHNGKQVEATLLTSTYQGMQLRSWMDKNGTVLRQETPMGWIMESCSAEEALESINSNTTPPDLTANKSSTMLMKMIMRKN